jgi:hypothetical protein
MTILSTTPANPNLLHPNKFQLNFARLPNLQFFCQTVIVPGIALTDIPRPSPFVELYSPGDKAIYDIMNVTFLVDEDLTAWKEIHDWIRGCVFPTKYEEYVDMQSNARPVIREKFNQFSDATLTLLTSANQPNYVFKFRDMFPISLSSFPVSASLSPDTMVTSDAMFRYSYYNIEKLN